MQGKGKLHHAAESGSKEAVLAAIAQGDDPKVKDFFGRTPLHYGAQIGNKDIVAILVREGSDPLATDYTQRTAKDYAYLEKLNDWEEVIEIIDAELEKRHETFRVLANTLPSLETIWSESYIDTRCEECGGLFEYDAPVRTISLPRLSRVNSNSSSRESAGIAAGDITIVFHNRHLGCIRGEGVFIAVSHVWHPVVSKAHNSRMSTPEAVYQAYNTPSKILQAAARRWGPDVEIWHDYISVPQWRYEVQQKLLIMLPTIFEWASRTLVHLQDIPRSVVLQMRDGPTGEDKLKGLMLIMQSGWYSRVWTNLEMMRSSVAHLVTSENEIFATNEDLFYSDMDVVFRRTIEREGSLVAAEKLAGDFGCWPVPDHVRLPRQSNALMNSRGRHRITLGHAYDILESLRCTVPHDKFVALYGLTGLCVPGGRVEDGNIEACTQLALACIQVGDCSPLLLCRMKGERELSHTKWLKGYDTSSIQTWQLGDQISSPLHSPAVSNGRVCIKLKVVGTVSRACKTGQMFLSGEKSLEAFWDVVKSAFAVTGRNEVDFVQTVGTQYYGIQLSAIQAHLGQQNRRAVLKEACDYLSRPDRANWPRALAGKLVEAMGISLSVLPESVPYKSTYSNSPLEYAYFEGGIAHNSGSSTLVTVTCPGCHKSSIFRAAAWEEPSNLLGAILYRIPSLQYSATLKNGVGLLIKDKRILGRTLYAVPACLCSILSKVELD